MTPSIYLTVANNWQELEEMATNGKLPIPLADCLKALVVSERLSVISPEAKPELIRLAKAHLANGIVLSDSATDQFFDIVVFVPDPGQEKNCRSFFKLIPKYPGGKFKYLENL
ncbi:MAG: hypothetical protein WC657_02485 [Candidatus Paceibacterota bacterium]